MEKEETQRIIGEHDNFLTRKFRERILMKLYKNLYQLEDKGGHALRPDYDSNYWKGARVQLKLDIVEVEDLK